MLKEGYHHPIVGGVGEHEMKLKSNFSRKPQESISYEPSDFAKRHGIHLEDARRILALHKGDHDSSNRAAHNLNGLN